MNARRKEENVAQTILEVRGGKKRKGAGSNYFLSRFQTWKGFQKQTREREERVASFQTRNTFEGRRKGGRESDPPPKREKGKRREEEAKPPMVEWKTCETVKRKKSRSGEDVKQPSLPETHEENTQEPISTTTCHLRHLHKSHCTTGGKAFSGRQQREGKGRWVFFKKGRGEGAWHRASASKKEGNEKPLNRHKPRFLDARRRGQEIRQPVGLEKSAKGAKWS